MNINHFTPKKGTPFHTMKQNESFFHIKFISLVKNFHADKLFFDITKIFVQVMLSGICRTFTTIKNGAFCENNYL